MNVKLPSELEQYVADKVTSGMYESTDDVLRQAIQALDEKEDAAAKLAHLRQELDKGFDDLAAGRTVPLTAELIESIKTRGRERNAAKVKTGEVRHA